MPETTPTAESKRLLSEESVTAMDFDRLEKDPEQLARHLTWAAETMREMERAHAICEAIEKHAQTLDLHNQCDLFEALADYCCARRDELDEEMVRRIDAARVSQET